MTVEEIKELIGIVNQSGIAELELQRGDNRVRIKRTNGASASHDIVLAHPPHVISTSALGGGQLERATQETTPPRDHSLEKDTTLIKSPIVGTFYESASPGAAPFVKIGDKVNPGQVLCIIESMKLMNEIEAEVSGTLVSKLVENGRPVEYGEALFAVRPD